MDNPATESTALDTHQAAAALDALFAADEPQAQAQEAGNEGESVEDAAARLAAEEAKGEGEEGQADAEPAAPAKVTIEVDGKPIELTPEQIAEAYKGQLRQADYTRKTMEAAEVRKAAEAEQAQARAQRDEYATKLEGFRTAADYEVSTLRAQLTDELLESDPVSYMKIQRTVEARQAQLQQANQELAQITEQRKQEKAEADRLNAAEQQEKLLAKLPEWKDPAKAKAELTQLNEYLAKEGYQGESENIPQHLQVVLARKAMMYDKLMEKAKSATQAVAKLPTKVERPGTPEVVKPDGRTTAMKRLSQTGSVNDAAAAFAQFL